MVEFKISPDKTCLLIIDMINVFLEPLSPLEIAAGRELIPRLKKLVSVCRDKGIRVIFVTMSLRRNRSDMGLFTTFRPEMRTESILIEGTEDVEFYREIQPEKDDIIIVKKRFSAFVGTELDLILCSNGIDTLIIGGVATNICCESTARDARMKDYKVIFLSDGTASEAFPNMGWGKIPAEEIQRVVLTTMAFLFGQVLSVEQLISQLSN